MKLKKSTLKKIDSTLWVAGTIVAFLFLIIVAVFALINNSKKDDYDSALERLEYYNFKRFGYSESNGVKNSDSYLSLKTVSTSDLNNAMNTISCTSWKLLNTFDLVSIEIVEPDDSIEDVFALIEDYVDVAVFMRNGVRVYCTKDVEPFGVFTDNSELLLEDNSDGIDDFLGAFEQSIYDNKVGLLYNVNYGLVPLVPAMHNKLVDKLSTLSDSDRIIVLLTLLKELGDYTSELDNLYSYYDVLVK